MKAMVQVAYGLPGALELRDVEMPRIGDGQILVKVHAASVNALDFHIARGLPYLTRIGGLRAPSDRIRGVDFSGRVEAVGRMQDLAEAGKLPPVIDRTFALRDGAEAFSWFAAGRAAGKVIITIQ